MRSYILRRLLLSVPLVFFMTFVIFAVINTNPQSALDRYILNPNISFQVIEQVKEQTGFYDAMPVRYAKWLGGVLFDIRIGRPRRALASFADPRQFHEQFGADTLASVADEPGTLSAETPHLSPTDRPEIAARLAALRPQAASFQADYEVLELPEPAETNAPSPRLLLRLNGADAEPALETAATLTALGTGTLRATAAMVAEAGLRERPVEDISLALEGGGRVAIRSVSAGLDLYTLPQPARQRPFLALALPAAETGLTLRNLGSPHLTHRLPRSDWLPAGKPIGATEEGEPILSEESFRALVLEVGNPSDEPAVYELRLLSGPPDSPHAAAVSFELRASGRSRRAFPLADFAEEGADLEAVRGLAFTARAPSRLAVYRLALEMDERIVSVGGVPNFGRSHDNIPVIEKLAGRIRNTVALVIASMLITWIVALPAGVIAAVRQYGVSDKALGFLTFVGMSLPSFFLAVLVRALLQEAANPESMLSFLPALPNSGRTSIHFESMTRAQQILDLIRHAIAPTLVLALGGMAGMQRVMRGTMLETLRQPFMVTARAKGLRERAVIAKHGLRNAITPFVAGFGSILPALIGGSLFVEMVFNYPGVGQMMYPAVLNRDLNLVMANTLIAALLLVLGNLIADILLALVDPRVSYD